MPLSRTTTIQSAVVIAILGIGAVAFIATHDRDRAAESATTTESLAETRSDLAARLLRAPDTLFVTPVSSSEGAGLETRFETMLEHLTGRTASERVLPADQVDRRTLGTRPVVLIGSPETNPHVGEALARFPIEIFDQTARVFDDASRIGVATTSFGGALPSLNLALRGLNPWNPDYGLLIVTGAEDAAIAEHAFHPDLEDSDYLVRLDDTPMRSGRLGTSPESALTPDPATDFNRFAGARSDYERSVALRKVQRAGRSGTVEDSIYGISMPRDEPRTREIMTALTERASALRRATRRLADGMEEPRLKIFVYPSREVKAAETGSWSPIHHISPRREIHLVFDDDFDARDVAPEMRIAVYDLFPSLILQSIREGLAIAASDRYGGEPLALAADRLLKADCLPSVAELLDNRAFGRLAPSLSKPAAGSFVAWTIATSKQPADGSPALDRALRIGHLPEDGPSVAEAVAKVYGEPLADVTSDWHEWIRETSETTNYVPPVRTPNPERPAPPALEMSGTGLKSPIGGARLVHSFRVGTGIGSEGLAAGLEELRKTTAARWVSIRPSAELLVTEDGISIVDFPSTGHGQAAWMPRGAVEACIETAHRVGLGVFLDPELHFAGPAPEIDGDEGWQRFFEMFGQWSLEWADVARRHEVELLGVGRGLGVTATGRLREWNRLTRQIRSLYDGRLTYVATSPEEIQGARHWAFLDLIGAVIGVKDDLDRQSGLRQATAEVVDDLARRAEVLSRRYKKPLFVAGLETAGNAGARAALVRQIREKLQPKPGFGGAFAIEWNTDPKWNREALHGRGPAIGSEATTDTSEWYRSFE